MSEQKINSGSKSVNTQVGGHNINAPGGSVNVGSDDSKKYEFIKEMTGIVFAGILGISSFFSNPPPEAHLKKIARGPYSGWQLDRDFFYDNNFFYSTLYVVGKDNERIIFSYGYFGRIQESKDFNYNLERIQGKR